MPIYEYQCQSCGRRFERIQKFSDPPIEKCPHCGGTVQKLPSSPAIQFKGSGWYITDYARKGEPAAKSEAGSSETKEKVDSDKAGESGSTSDSSKPATESGSKGTSTSAAPKSDSKKE